MKPTKCLMLKTKDSRKFFTYQKNKPLLEEFSKAFEAEISIVKVDQDALIDIDQLPNVICNPDYQNNIKYEKINNKPKRTRKETIKNAQKIQKYIRDQIKKGKSVSLKNLQTKFKNLNLTDSCLINHLKMASK